MQIEGKVAIVTGGGSGIGQAAAIELANRGCKAVAVVDINDTAQETAEKINQNCGKPVGKAFVGDVVDHDFRRNVYDTLCEEHEIVNICVPSAGIFRDRRAVEIDKKTGKMDIYPRELFQQVMEVNLLHPIYWAVEMVGRIAEQRFAAGLKKWHPDELIQGAIVFIGSAASQGNKGQISYATTKAGIEGAAATLIKESIYHGVRTCVIHPGFVDTPILRSMPPGYIEKYILPDTQLGRLIYPEEIADAICFMITNSAVSGELWADAGWHPPAG